jgi:hypothetical protein
MSTFAMVAARSAAIVDHDLLAELLSDLLAHETRNEIRRPTGWNADDETNRFLAVTLSCGWMSGIDNADRAIAAA